MENLLAGLDEILLCGLNFVPADCYCTTFSKETASPFVEISFKNVSTVKQMGWRQLAFSQHVALSGQNS